MRHDVGGPRQSDPALPIDRLDASCTGIDTTFRPARETQAATNCRIHSTTVYVRQRDPRGDNAMRDFTRARAALAYQRARATVVNLLRVAARARWPLPVWLALSAGCATVRPQERGKLASPAMNPSFGSTELTDQYRAKTLESKTATGLPGTAPGGGCGCSQ